MKSFGTYTLSESVVYCIENQIPIHKLYRPYSEKYFETFREARELFSKGIYEIFDTHDFYLLGTDIGEYGTHAGARVPLDAPMCEEKDIELNKPKRGGSKKYYVYVRDPQTKNVKKIEWGDTTGLQAKINDKDAAKSFSARHKCDQQNDKTTAAYWACRLPYYAKELGLDGGGQYFW